MRKTVELDESESAARQMKTWQQLKLMLAGDHPVAAVDETDHSYTVTCSSDAADAILERIQNFFKENTIREEFVAAATVGMATVVSKYLKDDITAVCSDFVACNVSVNVVVDDAHRGSGFVVRGTVHGLNNAVKRMRVLLMKVTEKKKTIDRPGIPQYLQSDRGLQAISSMESKHQAHIAEVVDGFVEKTVTMAPSAGPSVKLTVTVGKKFVMKIVVGDITKYKVDAIVNAANGSLDHAGGVARSIVDEGNFTNINLNN